MDCFDCPYLKVKCRSYPYEQSQISSVQSCSCNNEACCKILNENTQCKLKLEETLCDKCVHLSVCSKSKDSAKACEHFIHIDSIVQKPLSICPIGSTVYEVTPHGIWERTVAGYHYNTVGKQKGYYLIVGTKCGMQSRIKSDKIGKTVFLTVDEALEHIPNPLYRPKEVNEC